jgi:hypothetical protein
MPGCSLTVAGTTASPEPAQLVELKVIVPLLLTEVTQPT